LKRLKKKMKRLVNKVNKVEQEVNQTVDAMFQDRNLNGIVTVDEVGRNYVRLLREDLREMRRRKRSKRKRRKKR